MQLTELPQVRQSLDLLFTLVWVQILLDLGPVWEYFVLFDLSEVVVHARKCFQDEAQTATCLHICRRSWLLVIAELSDFLQGNEASVVVNFLAHIDKSSLENA